jgi:hypothetical protein
MEDSDVVNRLVDLSSKARLCVELAERGNQREAWGLPRDVYYLNSDHEVYLRLMIKDFIVLNQRTPSQSFFDKLFERFTGSNLLHELQDLKVAFYNELSAPERRRDESLVHPDPLTLPCVPGLTKQGVVTPESPPLALVLIDKQLHRVGFHLSKTVVATVWSDKIAELREVQVVVPRLKVNGEVPVLTATVLPTTADRDHQMHLLQCWSLIEASVVVADIENSETAADALRLRSMVMRQVNDYEHWCVLDVSRGNSTQSLEHRNCEECSLRHHVPTGTPLFEPNRRFLRALRMPVENSGDDAWVSCDTALLSWLSDNQVFHLDIESAIESLVLQMLNLVQRSECVKLELAKVFNVNPNSDCKQLIAIILSRTLIYSAARFKLLIAHFSAGGPDPNPEAKAVVYKLFMAYAPTVLGMVKTGQVQLIYRQLNGKDVGRLLPFSDLSVLELFVAAVKGRAAEFSFHNSSGPPIPSRIIEAPILEAGFQTSEEVDWGALEGAIKQSLGRFVSPGKDGWHKTVLRIEYESGTPLIIVFRPERRYTRRQKELIQDEYKHIVILDIGESVTDEDCEVLAAILLYADFRLS